MKEFKRNRFSLKSFFFFTYYYLLLNKKENSGMDFVKKKLLTFT